MFCESCGKEFSCGEKAGKCWCFEVELKTETLADLREDFKNCLCKDCLELKSNITEIK
ncbi:MAG: cysteine-rich CWC family protein [Pyrinomonadaceae bacterium]